MNQPLIVTEQQIAAAKLRIVLDRKLGRQTSDLVRQIADASPQTDEPPPPDGPPILEIGDSSHLRRVLHQRPDDAVQLPEAPQEFTGRDSEFKQLKHFMTQADAAQAAREYPLALRLYSEALGKSRENGDLASAASALSHLGSVYTTIGQHEKATSALTQALELIEQVANKGEAEQPTPTSRDT